MQPGSPNSRPTVARALELALRDPRPAGRVVAEPPTRPLNVPASYFAPGNFVGERDWWAKQLSGR
jgi:hypothetical protein